jgi:hypothetical protein
MPPHKPHKFFPHRSLARLLLGHKLTTPCILVALRTMAAHAEIPAIPYYCITVVVVDRTIYPALYVDAGSGTTFGKSSLVIPFRTDADGDILGLVESAQEK